jgi:hypothetical protein
MSLSLFMLVGSTEEEGIGISVRVLEWIVTV